MLGAAPTCKPYREVLCRLAVVAAGLATLLTTAGNAPAEVHKARDRVAPVWGIALDGRQTEQPNLELLAQAKAAGVNAVVTDPKRWSPERHHRLATITRQLGMFLIEPRRPSKTGASSERLRARCVAGVRTHHPCAFVARSAHEAVDLARRGGVDYVVVRLKSPADLDLVKADRSTRTQLIAVLTVGDSAKLDANWDQAIASVVKDPDTTLATGLSGAFAATAVRDYFTLLDKHDAGAPTFDQTQSSAGRAGRRDRLPPSTPLGAAATSATTTSLVLKWTASTDNVGVAGYGIYLGKTSIGSTGATTFTVTGLQCGSIYTFAVDAYDKRGNRSERIALTGSTSSCPLPPPSPPSPTPSPPSQPSQPPAGRDKDRPSTPTQLAISGITQTSATLTWNASTDNVGVVGYEVLNGNRSVGTTPTTSYLLAGLSCGTTYGLSVRAYDAAGNDSKSATIRVTTAPCSTPSPSPDKQAPTTPANVHLMGTTVSSITFAWSASSDNVGVAGYGVYRDSVLAGSTNSTSYTVVGLVCAKSYTVAVDAYDAAGNHSQRAAITVTTSSCPPAADTQAPTTPTNVHAVGATPTSVALAWNASTDNVGVTGYTVYNGGSAAGNGASTSYTVVGLSCGASYTLAVDAYDAAGNHSSKASVTASTSACGPAPDTQAPTSPGGLHVTTATATSITVAWTASADNVGVSGYGLYRSGISTGTTSSTNATFSGLTCNTGYTLAVDAYDAAGNRSSKASISTPTSACAPAPPPLDTQPPTVSWAKPGNGQTINGSLGDANCDAPASDNVGVNHVDFFLDGAYLNTERDAPYACVVDTTKYTNGNHVLKATAFDAAGNNASASITVNVQNGSSPPPPAPDAQAPTMPGGLHATAATTTSITIAWTASTDNVGVSGYGVYNAGSNVGTTAATSYTVSGLSCATAYTLAVDAYDAAGNRSSKASISASTSACPPTADTQAPTTPGGLQATGATGTSITVSWTASTDNVGVTGYGLYRNGTSTGTTGSASGMFSGLACGTGYTLAVDAFDAAGNHSAKATITASTSACPPPADTQAPMTPTGLRVTAAATVSISVAWTASTDNVGVTGYRLYRNGAQIGTSVTTAFVYASLTCGTSYTLGVAAVDAVGNVSGIATLTAPTAACSTGPAGNVYVSQTGAGSGDGSSCANATSAAFFNTAGNWGSGRAIAPGKVVGLCGTITSTLTAQGSGVSGSPITIQFQPGAKISQPACNPCLNLNNRSFMVVDGAGTGVIESNNNGTTRGLHSASFGIRAQPCNNCEIKGLTIQNIYVHSGSGNEIDQTMVRSVDFNGSNFSLHDNVIHDAGWAVTFGNNGESNVRIYNNDIYNVDHGVVPSFGTSGGSTGPYFVYGNHFHDFGNWDTSNNAYHHDGIHCYSVAGGAAQHISDFYIYNNRFDGNIGNNATAWIFLEGGSGGGSTPCSDSTSNTWIFNNVLTSSPGVAANGIITLGHAGRVLLANNFVGGPGRGTCLDIDDTSTTIYNNVVGGCAILIGGPAGMVVDNNAYSNCQNSSNCFWLGSVDTSNFALHQSQTGVDQHSVANIAAPTGSNAAGVGRNLTSMCTGNLVPLCSGINGSPRPSSGAWNAGAS